MKTKILVLPLLLVIFLVLGCQPLPTMAPVEVESVEPSAPSPLPEQPQCEPALQPPPLEQEVPMAAEETLVIAENKVEITAIEFRPRTLTIAAGETVTFTNSDSNPHWPASNLHPVHTTYPGSGIKKCGTSEESTIFDACHGLLPGEKYSFTFIKTGRWPYHDHLRPNMGGTIVVE